MPNTMDIEALLDNELPPERASLVRQMLAEDQAAMHKYRQLEMQKKLLLFWSKMGTAVH